MGRKPTEAGDAPGEPLVGHSQRASRAGRRAGSALGARKGDSLIADLHALRQAFVRARVAAGWHSKTDQGLARHANRSLSLDRPAHRLLENEARAIESLPRFAPAGEGPGERRLGGGLRDRESQGGA